MPRGIYMDDVIDFEVSTHIYLCLKNKLYIGIINNNSIIVLI